MSNTRKPKGKPSLFEVARKAEGRTEHYNIPLVDHDKAIEVAERLADAKRELKAQNRFGVAETIATAQEGLDAAQEAWGECFRRVTFKALSLKDMDVLTNAHPDLAEGEEPPEGHVEFTYHLAAASCVTDPDVTAEQWKTLCEEDWPGRQVAEFMEAVLGAQRRTFADGIPKD